MKNCTFILLGATGDLTKRKLIPAIYHLLEHQKIENLALVGAARTKTSISLILKQAKPFIKNFNSKVWAKLKKSAYYVPLDFYQENDYQKLQKMLSEIEKKHKLSGNRIFYLATLPQHFDIITKNLAKFKLTPDNNQVKSHVVYEKPFGENLTSAKKINQCIARTFKEDQVYRIDHYLGKELVGNISYLRFTNRFLEPLWNHKHIENVQIYLTEKLDVEKRGKFYDHYGAIKDVVQNHILQILSLVAMEPPKQLTGNFIRNEKAKVLKKTKVTDFLLGQYQGYKKAVGVKKDSKTETFAALKLSVNNPRWKNVPFYVKTGKALNKKETSVHIKFKPVHCLLTRSCPTDTNYLILRIYPDEGFAFDLNSKLPGRNAISPVKMEFCHNCHFGINTPAAYENLFQDVLKGDQSVFVRNDEIELAWKIVDNIKKNKIYTYKKGSKGPLELEKFTKKHKMRWRL